MGYALKVELEYAYIDCASCGLIFAMPATLQARLRKSHDTFYCPMGHRNFYGGKNSEEALEQQLKEEQRLRQAAERDAEWQRGIAKNAKTQQTKAQNKLKRITQRINAGVCPHCNRTFKQLAAHMKSKHPDKPPASEFSCNHDEVDHG